ncbi:WecB/TagA/CpsF family glycosyltransferase [Cellulophaga sp. HaHaR_3_176]|uniref:WecB/TagA/CpsF family glycosyltransferase n=1 Tax=Cellulophaga sp. HaHaR_3_176 TaxID=1942464 RepID=UPI001C1FDB11|nr:WecB/TagA/CpsF family glycosyltransferase [Cellulophaga sp. HaHaR_3_176]QWX84360.1 WecB/TagA/CpsF family glycosyltransferase [Cellulophaga sp. HaHaR_3_176]
MKTLNYTISTDYPKLPIISKTIINTINPHSYCVSKKDDSFAKALQSSDFLLPDGIGIVWASKFLNKKQIIKIAGFDIFLFLMKDLNETSGSCFFLGASQKTLNLIKQKAAKEYPNVKVNCFSPPYKAKFTEEDSTEMCNKVNEFKPDVLFVGMTAPKQEKWVYDFQSQLDSKVICSIGAVFDFYAGVVERPSQFWIKLGLEWLPRFLKEPKRLAERNLISTPKFILEVFSFKLRGKGFL